VPIIRGNFQMTTLPLVDRRCHRETTVPDAPLAKRERSPGAVYHGGGTGEQRVLGYNGD
jgi:hypothetical protein